jgi:peptidoglycan/LPS O-acetylase OafA/YrhL
MNDMWTGPLSLADYGNQILFLGNYHSEKADPVVWSLIYEMRISLIFPIIVAVLIRPSSVITLLIALLLSIGSFIWLVREGGDPGSANFEGSGIMTFHYIAFFMIGALLALRRDGWMPWLRQGKRAHWILALSLIAYFFTRRALFGHNGAGAAFLFDWLVAVGTVGIIATSIVSRKISAVLEHKAALFLGKISFSLYLTHLVVLLTVSHLMPKATEGNAAMILSAVMILPVALITYYLIERPSMRLAQGKRPVTLVEHKV